MMGITHFSGNMKTLFLAFAFIAFGYWPVIAGDAQLKAGSIAVARDPSGSALGMDSVQSLNQLMELARNQDQDAVRKLKGQGHVVEVKNGARVTILSFDPGNNAYKVHVSGSTKEVWLIKENVFAK
jgi:hypothetical protein